MNQIVHYNYFVMLVPGLIILQVSIIEHLSLRWFSCKQTGRYVKTFKFIFLSASTVQVGMKWLTQGPGLKSTNDCWCPVMITGKVFAIGGHRGM